MLHDSFSTFEGQLDVQDLRAALQSLPSRVCAGVLAAARRPLINNLAILPDLPGRNRHRHLVASVVDDDCTLERLYQLGGRIKRQAANPTFPLSRWAVCGDLI